MQKAGGSHVFLHFTLEGMNKRNNAQKISIPLASFSEAMHEKPGRYMGHTPGSTCSDHAGGETVCSHDAEA